MEIAADPTCMPNNDNDNDNFFLYRMKPDITVFLVLQVAFTVKYREEHNSGHGGCPSLTAVSVRGLIMTSARSRSIHDVTITGLL